MVLENVKRMRPRKDKVAALVESLMKPHCELMEAKTKDDALMPTKDYSFDGLNIKGDIEPSSFPELDAAHEVERCVAEELLVPPGPCATPEEMAEFVKTAALPVKPESTGASGVSDEEQVEL